MLKKTVTYLGLSAMNDVLFGTVFAGGVLAGGTMALIAIMAEPILYYAHEAAWAAGDARRETELIQAKTSTFGAANMVRVVAIGIALTGSPALVVGYIAFNAAADAVSYASNEAGWSYFSPIPDRAPPGPRLRSATCC